MSEDAVFTRERAVEVVLTYLAGAGFTQTMLVEPIMGRGLSIIAVDGTEVVLVTVMYDAESALAASRVRPEMGQAREDLLLILPVSDTSAIIQHTRGPGSDEPVVDSAN